MPRQVVYLKIPVDRNGFVDPPKINWSEAKEQKLWNIISNSKRTEVDWVTLSEQFGAPVTFLQQQAFWLYEQELEQLKNKIQKSTMSADTIIEDKSLSPESQLTLDNDLKSHTYDIFEKKNNNKQFKELKFKSQGDVIDEVIEKNPQLSDDESVGLDSDSESNSSSDEGVIKGSMLLHRSRILSKALPTFKDLQEDEEYELGHNTYQNNHETRDSSLSNFSSVSITKSALEEALLNDSNF